MARNCQNCTEKCPQAERANQAALGRMYATKEFIALLKKVENGELVEVVRCKDCDFRIWDDVCKEYYCNNAYGLNGAITDDTFCSYGERKDNDSF